MPLAVLASGCCALLLVVQVLTAHDVADGAPLGDSSRPGPDIYDQATPNDPLGLRPSRYANRTGTHPKGSIYHATAQGAKLITTSRPGPGELRRRLQKAVCDLDTESAAAMADCCADTSGHRRQQSAGCSLPGSCPSPLCAESFGRFFGLCGEMMRDVWGASDPQLLDFEAFYRDCTSQFGADLSTQIILPDDPNVQLIGRFTTIS